MKLNLYMNNNGNAHEYWLQTSKNYIEKIPDALEILELQKQIHFVDWMRRATILAKCVFTQKWKYTWRDKGKQAKTKAREKARILKLFSC